MATTYREIAIEQMMLTTEEAMSRVLDLWGDLPQPLKDELERFRTQLGLAVDSVQCVQRALDTHPSESS